MLLYRLSLCVMACVVTSALAPNNSPEISIHYCRPPTESHDWMFCCVSKNIHLSTITFAHQSGQTSTLTNIAEVRPPCNATLRNSSKYSVTCSKEGTTRIVKLKIRYTSTVYDTGTWTCLYYGGSSSLEIKPHQVLNKDSGYIFVNKTASANMSFTAKDVSNLTVYNPRDEVILSIKPGNWKGNNMVSHLQVVTELELVSFMLSNITFQDNGTYICSSFSDGRYFQDGVTLVVLDKLDQPTITPSDIITTPSFIITQMTLTCEVKSTAAAPYFFEPNFTVHWIYPDEVTTGYTFADSHNQLIVRNVDCNLGQSQPIFCSVQQEAGPVSNKTHFYPHDVCLYANVRLTTENPVKVIEVEVDKSDTDMEQRVAIGVSLSMTLFAIWIIFIIILYRVKIARKLDRCPCGLTYKCCAKTVCRRCCQNHEEDEFYSEYSNDATTDINSLAQREQNNLDNIVNIYTPGTEPELVSPPPRCHRDNEVDNNNVNNESGLRERGNNTPPPAGAEGIDRNVLIKEIESCFIALQKMLSPEQNQIQVTRDKLVDDVFNLYTDPSIVDSYLHVKMTGEAGSDWGGVSRDMFTSFWNEVSQTFFTGHSMLVPFLPPHKLEEEYKFKLLGRILSHSTAILGYIPVPLCKSVVMVTIFDTTNIDESALLEDFLQYLDREDRSLVLSALKDYSSISEKESDMLQNLFIRHDMGCCLEETTFREQLLKMARHVLCIKPRSLCILSKEGIPETHFQTFWLQMTIDHLKILHDRLKPTPEKVISCLRPDLHTMTSRRERIYGYFVDVIRDLSEESLERLLQFITGQAAVPRQNILIEFSDLTGAERRFIAHTCSYSLEIPDTYSSRKEFAEEFNCFITSDILRFDIQ